MSRFMLLSAAVLAFGISPAARGADEPKDILAKAIKAHGGEELLTKNKAARLKTKGKIDLPGVGEVDFTQETAYVIPGKFRETMEFKVAGQSVSVLTLINGDKIILEVNGKEIDGGDKVKDSVKDVGGVIDVGRLVPLKDKKYELNIIGEDKVGEKPVIGIRVSAKDKKDVSVYFDKETGLIAKIEHRMSDPVTGNEITEERMVTEYSTNKAGVPTPKKVLIKRDGKKFLEAEVEEITTLETIDESEFKK